jgi:hypothetical protein
MRIAYSPPVVDQHEVRVIASIAGGSRDVAHTPRTRALIGAAHRGGCPELAARAY